MIFKDGPIIDLLLDLKEKNGGNLDLVMYYKFGSDGSSGHPKFKQLMDEDRKQGACYVTGMIPLQIIAEMRNGDKVIGNHRSTLFENHPKCLIFQIWYFPTLFVLLLLTCLVILYDCQLQVFKDCMSI